MQGCFTRHPHSANIDMIRMSRIAVLVASLAAAGIANAAAAQEVPETWDAGRLQLTRIELEQLLTQYQRAGSSETYSAVFRLRAQSEADLVRRRLEYGDFQVGDQVYVVIEGEPAAPGQTVFPGSLTVGPNRVLALPGMGELSLQKVLRSELNEVVQTHVARYVKDPVVRSQALVRVAITGQVARPGFLLLPAESLLADALMAAGGPLATAGLDRVHIVRGSDRIWNGDVLQQAIADGRTIDQMSLRSGDQLVVPGDASTRSASVMRVATMVPAVILAVVGLIQVF